MKPILIAQKEIVQNLPTEKLHVDLPATQLENTRTITLEDPLHIHINILSICDPMCIISQRLPIEIQHLTDTARPPNGDYAILIGMIRVKNPICCFGQNS